MKEKALQFLKELSESPDGRRNRTKIRDIGSSIYQMWPTPETAKEVDAIVNAKLERPETPPGVGKVWKTWTPTPKGGEKNAVAPNPAVEDKKGAKKEQKQVPKSEDMASEMTLGSFGIGPETWEDLTKLDPEQFVAEVGGLDNARQIGRLLEVKSFHTLGAMKLVNEIQKKLPDAFSKVKDQE